MGGRAGGSIRAGRGTKRNRYSFRRTKQEAWDGTAVRFVICGIVFVGLIFGKLLFPQTMGKVLRRTELLLGCDADFQGAVAAMGRAISGEDSVGDALGDACAAVFAPGLQGEGAVEVMAPAGEAVETAGEKAPSAPTDPQQEDTLLEKADPPQEESVLHLVSLPVFAESDAEALSSSQVYMMPAMPENASLEQRNLPFSHQSPLRGRLTSPFGWREHPVLGGTRFHHGVDLSGTVGTEIHAFADGEVYAVGESTTLGKYVMLRHQDKYVTLYAHCSVVTVQDGPVKMGDLIGEVGDTGRTTGPHLHFELRQGSLYLNPVYYVDLETD